MRRAPLDRADPSGLGLAASIFTNKLAENLQELAPTASRQVLVSVQAIYETSIVPIELRAPVIEAYMRSLRQIYIMGVPLSILMILTAFIVANVNIKGP